MKKIFISTEYITLNQFLKMAGLINNGGQAKFWLLENEVIVDKKRRSSWSQIIWSNDC